MYSSDNFDCSTRFPIAPKHESEPELLQVNPKKIFITKDKLEVNKYWGFAESYFPKHRSNPN
jgi:hypothetical protein